MGTSVGRYQIIRELGRGTMGIVYEARDPQLNRTVALKLLSVAHGLQGSDRRQAIERFMREGRAAGGLLHPNIAQVFDVGEDQGRNYIVMELCEGTLLRNILSFEGRVPESKLHYIAEQLLSALETAHARGIIHRDIKPDNIMIGRNDRLKLMDFGIAKVVGDGTMTAAGQSLGSPAYMSPEQVLGKPVDARSDIFAVGVVLYECLAGRKPFDGPSITAVTHKIAFEDPPPLSGVSPYWAGLVMRALAKDPAARFQTASQMAVALGARQAPSAPAHPNLSSQLSSPQNLNQTRMVGGIPPVQQTQMGFPQAPTGPQMGQPVYQSMPPPAYAKPHHGPMILTFGILSLLCCVPLGIAAWIMGAMDLNEMNAGRMDRTGFSQTQAGLVCGAIGTVLGTLWFLVSLATTP